MFDRSLLPDREKLLAYGFTENDGIYAYHVRLLDEFDLLRSGRGDILIPRLLFLLIPRFRRSRADL